MNINSIKGGYILQPRSWDKSRSAHFPPVTRELWFYLLRNVNHKGNGISKRGERYFSLDEIQNALSWSVGYRVMKYSKPQLTKALRRLREEKMIETPKATHGIHVSVINYDAYQSPENYEGNDEGNAKATRRKSKGNANKNEKNERIEDIDGALSSKVPPDKNETYLYFIEIGLLKNEAKEQTIKFHDHHDARGWILSNRKKMVDWKAAVRTWKGNMQVYSQQNGKLNGNGKVHFKTKEELTVMRDEEFWKYYAPYRQYCESPTSTFFPTRDEATTGLLQHFANTEAKYARG
ncbi:MAG: hypothetical protein HGA87_00890 [Desulfobulbaceae bacterium]|nr:hypothetical protein [Desulfobulbaceae bacterium]